MKKKDKPLKHTYFLVQDSNSKLVFEIDSDGNVNYLVDGKMKKVTNQKELGLAFAGAILCITGADPVPEGISVDKYALKASIKMLKTRIEVLKKEKK